MQRVGQYLGPLLDINLDIHNGYSSEAQKDEMVEYLMVWHLGDVLANYLDQYWASYMDIYVDNLLTCG